MSDLPLKRITLLDELLSLWKLSLPFVRRNFRDRLILAYYRCLSDMDGFVPKRRRKRSIKLLRYIERRLRRNGESISDDYFD